MEKCSIFSSGPRATIVNTREHPLPLPPPSMGLKEDMKKYGENTKKYEENMKEYVENLKKYEGNMKKYVDRL